MSSKSRLFILAALISVTCYTNASANPGPLIIAGGGVEPDNAEIWNIFIEAANENGTFVIIPSASASPTQSAKSVKDILIRHGVSADAIQVSKLALFDDQSTPDIDESQWAENSDDPVTVAQLRAASAIWFTGGDQLRTTTLLLPESQTTPVLQAIRHAHQNGAVIGGNSAGAAIMSDPMIQQGDSLTALTGSTSGEPLELTPGLGFFEAGLVDQHFGERARLGRLVVALSEIAKTKPQIGFGIDENTALVVESNSRATVAGSGYVTIINTKDATFGVDDKGRQSATNIALHLASSGDHLALDPIWVKPATWKAPTVGDEYVRQARPSGGGFALPAETLSSILGEALVDNSESQRVSRISFDHAGLGTRFIFSKSESTTGDWGRHPVHGSSRYTINDVTFDIEPIQITILNPN